MLTCCSIIPGIHNSSSSSTNRRHSSRRPSSTTRRPTLARQWWSQVYSTASRICFTQFHCLNEHTIKNLYTLYVQEGGCETTFLKFRETRNLNKMTLNLGQISRNAKFTRKQNLNIFAATLTSSFCHVNSNFQVFYNSLGIIIS